jgi:hypothetical protein
MGYATAPGPVGLDPDASGGGVNPVDTQPIHGLSEGAPEPLANQPKIIKVTRDWGDPPTPSVTLEPTIGGTSLKEALSQLQNMKEWGEGGGILSGPSGQIKIEPDNGRKELCGGSHRDVHHQDGGLVRLRKGDGCAKASLDAMIAKLRKHEQEHVNIAYKNAQKLIRTLTNLPGDQAQAKITESFQAEADAQVDFDSDAKTAHGAKAFGTFPVVELDTSADPPPPPPKPPPKP